LPETSEMRPIGHNPVVQIPPITSLGTAAASRERMNFHELRKNDEEFRGVIVEIERKAKDHENLQLFRLILVLMALALFFDLGIVGLLLLFTR